MPIRIEIIGEDVKEIGEMVSNLALSLTPVRVNPLATVPAVAAVQVPLVTAAPPPAPAVAVVPAVGLDAMAARIDQQALALAQAAPAVTAPVDQGLDTKGLLWDQRIHSSNHEKNKGGDWRRRRGVDKTVLAQVEAEILANVATGTPVQGVLYAAPDVATGVPTATASADDNLHEAIDLATKILTASNVQTTGAAVEKILIDCGLPPGQGIPALLQQPGKAGAVHFGLLQLAQSLGVAS